MKIAKIILAVVLALCFFAVLFVGMSAIAWEFGQWASNYVREWIELIRRIRQ